MEYTIENECLRLTVSEHGAEMQALHRKCFPEQPLLWDGQKEFWGRRAPVCFPWCGKIEEGWFEADGKRYENAPQHGFIRDVEHTLIEQLPTSLAFRFSWPGDETRWPWPFSFETCHKLIGNTVETSCTATNTGTTSMPVQLGFHTALRCPFTPGKELEDYIVRFQLPEAGGGKDVFPLNAHCFDHDSICFPGLRSGWLQVEEAQTGQYLRIDTGDYPYVLLWSTPGGPHFVCIEPWTGYVGPGHDLAKRPGAVVLQPGDTFTRVHRLTVGIE